MITVHGRLTNHRTAHEALAALCHGFFGDESWVDACPTLEAGDLPKGVLKLLVHREHMTATLNEHYGQPVELRVLEHRQTGEEYRRKIVLTVDGGAKVVEFGMVRLNLAYVDEAIRTEILARRTPLGDILRGHEVLTHVEPRWYLRFPGGCPVVGYLGLPSGAEAFGRLATINVDGEPAVDLLEVVPA